MFWPRYMYWCAWSRLSLSTTMFDCVVVFANSVLVSVLFIFKPILPLSVCSSFTVAYNSCGSFTNRTISTANLRLLR